MLEFDFERTWPMGTFITASLLFKDQQELCSLFESSARFLSTTPAVHTNKTARMLSKLHCKH